MSNESPLKIVIIGAGIAGLSAARALRGEGHEITVLERSQQLREIGAAITTAPNATTIVLGWGLDPKRVGSVKNDGFQFFAPDGTAVPFCRDYEQIFGAPLYSQHRVDLHTELRRLATTVEPNLPGQPALLRTGVKIVDVNVETGDVTLDGGEVVHGDVIIGADGIRSAVRSHVVEGDTTPNLEGLSVFRALIPVEDLEKGNPAVAEQLKKSLVALLIDRKSRAIAYWARNKTVLNVAVYVPNEVFAGESYEYEGVGDMNRLKEYCGTSSAPIALILSCMNEAAAYQIRTLNPLPTWVKGRAIIIGDAAHAMTPFQGQGGSSAIEDAEALGVYFRSITSSTRSASEINTILKNVEAVRHERASFIQAKSLAVGKTFRASPEQALAPEETPQYFGKDALQFQDFNYSYRGAEDWARKHELALPA